MKTQQYKVNNVFDYMKMYNFSVVKKTTNKIKNKMSVQGKYLTYQVINDTKSQKYKLKNEQSP